MDGWRARARPRLAARMAPCGAWIDCDPGHDDAFAVLALARGAPDAVTLRGVSSVGGNQATRKTTENARRVLAWIRAGREVTLARGAERPLTRRAVACAEIHGESGLDGSDGTAALPEADARTTRERWSEKPGAVAMYEDFEAFRADGGNDGAEYFVVATGPLTNVALMISLYRARLFRLDERLRPVIFLMGGAIGEGNTGARAEFNIQCDPEAAHIVFESGLEIRMVPLEVTHTALVTPEILDLLCRSAENYDDAEQRAQQIRTLLTFFATTYRDVFGFESPPLHDPCAAFAACLRARKTCGIDDASLGTFEDCFTWSHERVDVECASPLTYGQTVVDRWRTSGRPKNVHIATKMDVEKFFKFLAAAIARGASA